MELTASRHIPHGLPFWSAPAKLNLFLHITGRRDDGYHNLQTVFQLLDFGDELVFDLRQDGVIRRVTGNDAVPEAEDLVVKAARLLQRHAPDGAGVDIYLIKRLPMGGGLGGGSSDAATLLRVLNVLWGCGLDVAALAELGKILGADVPVFVHGETSWGEGIGDQLTPVVVPNAWYLVLRPEVSINTAALFSSEVLTRDCLPIKLRPTYGGVDEKALQNVFEPVVRKSYRQVDEAMSWLSLHASAKLTGTGSCIYAAFGSRQEAERILSLAPPNLKGFVARGVDRSTLLEQLDRYQL